MYLYSTIVLGCISLALVIALWMQFWRSTSSPTELRLLGTWISNAEETVEMMPASTNRDSEAFQKTRALLGKMKVTFSAKEMSIELDGQVDRFDYRVLASDDYSCAIEVVADQPLFDKEIRDIMKPSKYSVIHFEEPDSYWVQSQYGGFAEYFRRISQ